MPWLFFFSDFFRRIWILSLHCILFFLPRHFSGVPSKVQMDSTVPASSAPTISVSARQDLQNTFTAKTPRHFEGEFFMEKYFFLFIWELQYVSCSVRDFISQVHGQDFSLYVLHLYSSMKNAFFPERKRQKKKRFSGFTPESLFFVLPTYYAAGSSAVISGALSSTADSIVMRSPSASSCGTPAFFRFSVRTVQSAFVRYSVIAS